MAANSKIANIMPQSAGPKITEIIPLVRQTISNIAISKGAEFTDKCHWVVSPGWYAKWLSDAFQVHAIVFPEDYDHAAHDTMGGLRYRVNGFLPDITAQVIDAYGNLVRTVWLDIK
jgi:hypothetical protein